jgi:hypothetical protein
MDEKLETTPETQTAPLAGIDQATLTPLVQSALNSETVEVIDWDVQQVHGGSGGGVRASAVYRCSGRGRDQGHTVSWSLILKTFSPAADADPSAPYYPRREADAYRSGWLDDLPGRLAAPAGYGVVEPPDGGIWVWLEEVAGDAGPRWPMERYALAARHLGQFNGAYLAGHPLPTWPWFSARWLRRVVTQAAPSIAQLPDVLQHPLGRRYFPGDTSARFYRLWAERERLLDALERLPRTICHLDAFSRNLFSRQADHGDQTVVIDWAFVGGGAVGEELEPLVCRTLLFTDVELAHAQELDGMVFAGYLDGLRDAGWQGDPRQVRLGYTAAVTLRCLVSIGEVLPIILDESLHFLTPQIFGRPFEEMLDHDVACRRFQFGLEDEALQLLDTLF